MLLRSGFAAIVGGVSLMATAAAFAKAPQFRDSDRMRFIGDSITHQARYHTPIVLFYTTRFPHMRLTTWNCGFGGDTAAGAKIVKQGNCRVSALTVNGGEVAFTCLANALPFPVDAEHEQALELVPFTQDLNQELRKVSGLPAGSYRLSIDGRPLLTTTAAALAKGINLATVRTTPQYQQAQALQLCMSERALIEGRKLRTFAQVRYLFFADLEQRTPEIERRRLETTLERLRGRETIWARYQRRVIETYQEAFPQKEALERQSAALLARIQTARIPQPHAYRLQRTGKWRLPCCRSEELANSRKESDLW